MTEQYNSVSLLLKSFISVLLVGGLVAYRNGPGYVVYIAKEMPHLVLTLPLVVTLVLYLWTQRLLHKKEALLSEQSNLKPQITE